MKSKVALVMLPLCAVILLVTVVVLPSKTYAQSSLITGLGFSGKVIGPVLLPFAFPACPYHILVLKADLKPGASPVNQTHFLGIIPGPGSKIFREFNILTPGNWLLGTYVAPIFFPPVCPYPVGPLIQTGTGLFPGK